MISEFIIRHCSLGILRKHHVPVLRSTASRVLVETYTGHGTKFASPFRRLPLRHAAFRMPCDGCPQAPLRDALDLTEVYSHAVQEPQGARLASWRGNSQGSSGVSGGWMAQSKPNSWCDIQLWQGAGVSGPLGQVLAAKRVAAKARL